MFFSKSSASNIYQNFKGTNFPLETASDSCDDISGRHVTHVIETRTVTNEQKYNNFSIDSTGICNQFEKVYPSGSPANRISRLGDSVEMKLFLPQRKVEEISQNALESTLTLRYLAKLLGNCFPQFKQSYQQNLRFAC